MPRYEFDLLRRNGVFQPKLCVPFKDKHPLDTRDVDY